MQSYLIWGYVHILLLVFWLGTDVGVLAAIAMARNPKRSFEARVALIKLSQSLDVLPRACLALMLPVGLHLSRALDLYPISDQLLAACWSMTAFWLAALVITKRKAGTALARNIGRARLVTYVIVGLIFVVIGLNSLATGAPLEEPWYAVKFLLFGVVFWTSIAVDLCFAPFQVPFMEIGQHGSDPEREEAVRRAVSNTIAASAILYILIAAIAYIGKVKPL